LKFLDKCQADYKLAYFGLPAAYLLGLLDPAKCIEELCLAIGLIKLISILKDGVSLDFSPVLPHAGAKAHLERFQGPGN